MLKARARLTCKWSDNKEAILDLPWDRIRVRMPGYAPGLEAVLALWPEGQYADVELYADDLDGVVRYSFDKIENVDVNA